MTVTPGATLGPYRVLEQIGRGGMATVYKAHQPALARYVALKVLPQHLADQPGFRERFQAEAVSIGKLRHQNILQVFDFGEEGKVFYIVTEFIDGGTLADQLGAALPPDYVARTLAPIAGALDYAHARGVVHRDIKPSNVLLARDGTPILSDFGLATMIEGALPRLTQTGAVVGTPEYMAPEQAQGEDAGSATDRYALAIVAYEMLTGHVPYSADTPLATLLAHAHKPLPLPRERNPQLSPELEAVLLKGLAKEPQDRYRSAGEFVRELQEQPAGARAHAATAPQAAVIPAPAVQPVAADARRGAGAARDRRPLVIGLIAGAVLLALGVTAAAVLLGGGRAAVAPPSPTQTVVPAAPLTADATLSKTTIQASTDLPPGAAPDPERMAIYTISYVNNTDQVMRNVMVVFPQTGTGIAIRRADEEPPGYMVYRQPDLRGRSRGTLTIGLFSARPGAFPISAVVQADGVPDAATTSYVLTVTR